VQFEQNDFTGSFRRPHRSHFPTARPTGGKSFVSINSASKNRVGNTYLALLVKERLARASCLPVTGAMLN